MKLEVTMNKPIGHLLLTEQFAAHSAAVSNLLSLPPQPP